jgi:serralysin
VLICVDRAGFDRACYLATIGDVAAAGIDPFCHYLSDGWREGRDPSSNFSAINPSYS